MNTRFRKKPVEVEAVEFTGDNLGEVSRFVGEVQYHGLGVPGFHIVTEPDEGDEDIVAEVYDVLHSTWVGVKLGQWIIRGVQGEFYPCDPDVFEATYSAVNLSDNLVEVGPEAFADLELTVISYKGENYYSEDFKKSDPEEYFYHDANTMDKVYAALSLVGLDEELQAILLEEFDKHGLLIRELRTDQDD